MVAIHLSLEMLELNTLRNSDNVKLTHVRAVRDYINGEEYTHQVEGADQIYSSPRPCRSAEWQEERSNLDEAVTTEPGTLWIQELLALLFGPERLEECYLCGQEALQEHSCPGLWGHRHLSRPRESAPWLANVVTDLPVLQFSLLLEHLAVRQ